MAILKFDPIIIVGGGAFGLSTALHLTRSGYTNISVYERDDHNPPRYSAANDLNKIVRAEYEDPFYTDLTIVSFSPIDIVCPSDEMILTRLSRRKPSLNGRLLFLLRISIRQVSYTACLVMLLKRLLIRFQDSALRRRTMRKSSLTSYR